MAEPKFVIQGVDYPVPDWFSFTMDESEILYNKTGLTLDQIDEDIKFSPNLLSTLMLVAYLRGNPGAPLARAQKIIGAIQLTDVIETLFPDVEEDAGPPSQKPSETDSADANERNDESARSSGDGSANDSGSQDADQARTGTLRSVTPQDSDQAISAS